MDPPAEGRTKRDAGSSSTKRDAGSATSNTKRDAGRARDAEAESEDDPEPEDEEEDDSEDQDSAPVAKDAGSSAKQDAGKPGSTDAGSGTPAASASCAELTYASFGEMFLKTYCYECHSSKVGMPLGGVVLDAPAGVAKSVSVLKRMVIPRADGKEPAMPKGGNDDLTDAERVKFGQWIDCGAK
jgi:cytochrome c5